MQRYGPEPKCPVVMFWIEMAMVFSILVTGVGILLWWVKH
jgi:hypothetical protein